MRSDVHSRLMMEGWYPMSGGWHQEGHPLSLPLPLGLAPCPALMPNMNLSSEYSQSESKVPKTCLRFLQTSKESSI